MATYQEATIQQGTYEIRKWTADFTDDIPSGGSVSGGTAYHTPPSGSAATPTITVSSPYVSAQFSNLVTLGQHQVDIVATYSNGEKGQIRIAFAVVYPSPVARSGMLDLITELRSMTEATPGDYSIAGNPYWTDAQLQDVLDINRRDVVWEALQSYPYHIAGGSLSYKDYRSAYGFYEATTGGTEIFTVQDSTGAYVAAGSYTPDYRRGVVLFGANQAGTAYYLTGRSYDLHAAAAAVWRRKAAHVAPSSFDFSTDNHSISRSQVYNHCLEMAEFFEGKSGDAIQSVSMFRSDVE